MRSTQISAAEEREFERKHVWSLRERYLRTDVLKRVETDPGYRQKILLIERALRGTTGRVLDLGANTCGEAEVLSTRGYSIVALDVNDLALGISRERVAVFRGVGPTYVAGDALRLPLRNESVAFVISFEILHHLESPETALREANRVLAPNGRMLLFEPYAFDPYRRLSELRDRLRGSIETSFGTNETIRLLNRAGFAVEYLSREVLRPSEWKMQGLSSSRRILRDLHYRVERSVPWLFASVFVVAFKRGDMDSVNSHIM